MDARQLLVKLRRLDSAAGGQSPHTAEKLTGGRPAEGLRISLLLGRRSPRCC